MDVLLVICLSVVFSTAVLGIPPPTPMEMTLKSAFKQDNFTFIYRLLPSTPNLRRASGSFKHKYVYGNGAIQNTRGSGYWFDVEATYSVSETAHYRAALIVSKMTRNMPASIFNSLATNAKVGIFTKSETLAVFPELSYYRDRPGCSGSCSGGCANTCTFDGRKYSSLAGTGGQVAAMVDDNVLCDGKDPYSHNANMLVHELGHTVKLYALPADIKAQITAAYTNARYHNTWDNTKYAMSTEEEYWAESTQVYFNVEHLSYTTGGMNTCGHGYCSSERDSRYYLWQKDSALYGILTHVYTDNHPEIVSGLSLCVTS